MKDQKKMAREDAKAQIKDPLAALRAKNKISRRRKVQPCFYGLLSYAGRLNVKK